ncbi:MAG: TipAS antibiotic-recognition domain-containing protein [Actinomycetota bacterium]
MSWPIEEVARLSGVTSRTLRHYDAVGLLPPAGVAANGHRCYERPQLLRLQEILLLRALGLPLPTIAAVLDSGRDQIDALRHHQAALLAESDRLAALAHTVELTIEDLQKGNDMPAEQLFEGFDPKQQAEYENEIAAKYGDSSVAESRRRTAGWTPAQFGAVDGAYQAVDARLVALLSAGVAPDDARVFEVLADHYAIVDQFWTPDRPGYTGLGQMYVDDPRFRARHDEQHPDLAEYKRDAMAAYAELHLS